MHGSASVNSVSIWESGQPYSEEKKPTAESERVKKGKRVSKSESMVCVHDEVCFYLFFFFFNSNISTTRRQLLATSLEHLYSCSFIELSNQPIMWQQ